MTKRDRVTVNLLPADAEWLRAEAEGMDMSLSEVLQTVIGTVRVLRERQQEKAHRKLARELRDEAKVSARAAVEAAQLDLFQPSQWMH
jgi:hypothetical protein